MAEALEFAGDRAGAAKRWRRASECYEEALQLLARSCEDDGLSLQRVALWAKQAEALLEFLQYARALSATQAAADVLESPRCVSISIPNLSSTDYAHAPDGTEDAYYIAQQEAAASADGARVIRREAQVARMSGRIFALQARALFGLDRYSECAEVMRRGGRCVEASGRAGLKFSEQEVWAEESLRFLSSKDKEGNIVRWMTRGDVGRMYSGRSGGCSSGSRDSRGNIDSHDANTPRLDLETVLQDVPSHLPPRPEGGNGGGGLTAAAAGKAGKAGKAEDTKGSEEGIPVHIRPSVFNPRSSSLKVKISLGENGGTDSYGSSFVGHKEEGKKEGKEEGKEGKGEEEVDAWQPDLIEDDLIQVVISEETAVEAETREREEKRNLDVLREARGWDREHQLETMDNFIASCDKMTAGRPVFLHHKYPLFPEHVGGGGGGGGEDKDGGGGGSGGSGGNGWGVGGVGGAGRAGRAGDGAGARSGEKGSGGDAALGCDVGCDRTRVFFGVDVLRLGVDTGGCGTPALRPTVEESRYLDSNESKKRGTIGRSGAGGLLIEGTPGTQGQSGAAGRQAPRTVFQVRAVGGNWRDGGTGGSEPGKSLQYVHE